MTEAPKKAPSLASVNRLAIAKHLLRQSEEQLQNPEPISSVSILSAHDALEIFLRIAVEHLDITMKSEALLDYWPVISAKIKPKELSKRESMARLIKARVGLKHHGTIPALMDVKNFHSEVSDFFRENCANIFGLQFDDIDLSVFVECPETRSAISEAKMHLSAGQYEDAVNHATVAFGQLLRFIDERTKTRWAKSAFNLENKFRFGSASFKFSANSSRNTANGVESLRSAVGQGFDRLENELKGAFDGVHEAIKMIGMGIDYRKYVRFHVMTPNVMWTMAGKCHLQKKIGSTDAYTADDALFCIDFVVDCGLRLRGIDIRTL